MTPFFSTAFSTFEVHFVFLLFTSRWQHYKHKYQTKSHLQKPEFQKSAHHRLILFCSVNSQLDQKEEDKEPVKKEHTQGENDTDDFDSDIAGDDDLSDFEEENDENCR